MNPYQQNVEKYQQTADKLSKKIKELSWSRVVVFVFSAFFIVLLASNGVAIMVWLVALGGGIGFAILMKEHNQATYQKQHATFLAEVNQQEILRQQNQLSTFPDGAGLHPARSSLRGRPGRVWLPLALPTHQPHHHRVGRRTPGRVAV